MADEEQTIKIRLCDLKAIFHMALLGNDKAVDPCMHMVELQREK